MVETTGDGFHGDDGFNNVKFSHTPNVNQMNRKEGAHQAVLRYTREYPGNYSEYKKINGISLSRK